jgi:hypothetical protein
MKILTVPALTNNNIVNNNCETNMIGFQFRRMCLSFRSDKCENYEEIAAQKGMKLARSSHLDENMPTQELYG